MSDPTSQANYDEIYTSNVDFDWTIDWTKKVIAGSATHTLFTAADEVKIVVFDTIALNIHKVEVDGATAEYELGKKHEVMGESLTVKLPSPAAKGQKVSLKISYETTDGAVAIQWLEKEQTQGNSFPYLFSQCQPIYARSVAPLQDTPALKITYTAKVTSVLPVLLSAIRISPSSEGPAHDGKEIGKDSVTYVYKQPVGIPSYLIAIASGNVRYKAFKPFEGRQWKTGVWAEPEILEQSYWEFSEDTARFLAKEEDIVGEYKFGVYDLLVLPPSFPYGGMENACLSFLTPTLLTGDRSLVDVVVHELTHSWFGNGVTHAEASHFWLNEGWTNYIERLLQQYLHSPAERGFSFLIGSAAMTEALKYYSDRPKYQRLVIDFEKGEDPDDAYSSIPYEKGSNFLLYLEKTLGGLDVFLPYVRDYVSTFIGKSITTDMWKSHLISYFEKNGGEEQKKALKTIDWDAWLFGEGLKLPVQPEYDISLAKPAHDLAARWDAARVITDLKKLDFKDSDIKDFSSNQKVVFLEKLGTYAPLPSEHLRHLGELYAVSTTGNAEIRLRFYQLALAIPDRTSALAQAFAEEALKWAVGKEGPAGVLKGRMKFCRPAFRGAAKINKELARKYYAESKDNFHPIAKKLLEKDVESA